MSLAIYSELASAAELFDLPVYKDMGGATYDLNGCSKPTALVSFIEINTAGDWLWPAHLEAIHQAQGGSVEVIAVFCKTSGGVFQAVEDDDITTAKPPALDLDAMGFLKLRDNGGAGSAAGAYYNGFTNTVPTIDPSGASATTPYTYLLYATTTGLRVVDKLHLASPDSGDSQAADRDLIVFKTGGGAADWSPGLADLEDYLLARIDDHLDDSPRVTVSLLPPAGEGKITEGSKVRCVFSEKAVGAWNPASYGLSGGSGGAVAVDAHTQVYVDDFLAGSPEACDLVFSSLTHGDPLTLWTDAADTDGLVLAMAGDLSYQVDLVAPGLTVTPLTPSPTRDPAVIVNLQSPDADIKEWALKINDANPPDPGSALWQAVPGAGPHYSQNFDRTLPAEEAHHTFTAWGRDAAGNVSSPADAVVHLDLYRPAVTAFALESVDSSTGVFTITSLAAADTGTDPSDALQWLVTHQPRGEAPAAPGENDPGWSALAPSEHDLSTAGYNDYTLFAWVKDAAGWVSEALPGARIDVAYQPAAAATTIVLALDYSASMNWTVPVDADGVVTEEPRIDHLRPATTQFIDEWAAFYCSGGNDAYGLVVYRSSAEKITASLQPLAPNAAALIAYIENDLQPGGNTALGAGLANALDLLRYSEDDAAFGGRRALIVFSDGQQNIRPYVAVGGGDPPAWFEIDTNDNGAASGCPGGNAMGVIHVEGTRIPIYTIGLGTNTTWLERLVQLAVITGGTPHSEDMDNFWPALPDAYQDDLLAIYGGCSPQLVRRTLSRLELDQERRTESFLLNRTASRIMVSLNWLGPVPLGITLKKGGLTVKFDTLIQRERYCIGIIALPRRVPGYAEWFSPSPKPRAAAAGGGRSPFVPGGPAMADIPAFFGGEVTAEGTWRVEIERRHPGAPGSPPAVAYSLAVIADEPVLDYSVATPNLPYRTGDRFRPAISIWEAGAAPAALYAVEAEITRPRWPAANLILPFLKQAGLKDPPAPEDPENPAQAAVRAALKNRSLRGKLAAREKTTLKLETAPRPGKRRNAGASLAADYGQLRVPGVHRITYRISGSGGLCGPFERMVTRTVLVRPRCEPRCSRLRAELKGNKFTLGFLFRDRFGNVLGPGNAEELRFTLDGKERGSCRDRGDGSYLLELKIKDSQELRRKLTVTVGGSRFLSATLAALLKSYGKAAAETGAEKA